MNRRSWRSGGALFVGGLIVAIVLAACGAQTRSAAPAGTSVSSSRAPVTARTEKRPPNIVFVLTDDLSLDLIRYMPQVQAMQRQGLTHDNYFVTDSLCCPSRSSIFTGNFPHDTGVFTNTGSDGGIGAFYRHHEQQSAFNVHLQHAGYRTALMGKYLNGYMTKQSPVSRTYVPPGWNEWDVAGKGYPEFNYDLNQNGKLVHYGHQSQDYLVDVMARKGASFVTRTARSGKPFFLELATFAPHAPYTPAPRYAHYFPGLKAPEPPNFDVLPSNAPHWLQGHQSLSPRQRKKINRAFRRRVQDVQAVDDMITRIKNTLKATGQLKNTYIVFSSDNGYHTGEYRLTPGKQTAFDTDIHVPLVIDGPGVPADRSTGAMTQNVDLASTFEQLASSPSPSDGHALLPTFRGGTPSGWRNAVLVEHHGPDLDFKADPDAQHFSSGDPTTYEAMRTRNFTYVEYRDGEREFYNLRRDPYELHNAAGSLNADQRTHLHAELARMKNCHGGSSCWAAEHVDVSP